MGHTAVRLLLCLVLAAGSFASAATELTDRFCLDCHADKTLTKTTASGKEVSVFVDKARLASSVHATNACVSCHVDVTAKHPDDNKTLQPVSCISCHSAQSRSYTTNAHGIALAAGNAAAATCKDCHGVHDVLAPTSMASPLHFTRQAETCGACHNKEAADVAASVHGRAAAAGKRDAPACTDCHLEHQLQTEKSKSPLRVSEEVCGNCHASERINTKYKLPPDRVKTFFNSYHGLAAQYGSTLVANCDSCHGHHRILPSSDPESTIHPTHLVETCGKCHPGANDKFALGKIHVDAASAASAAGGDGVGGIVNWWVRRVYLVLIFGTIGAMLAHNGLLLYKKVSAHLRASGRPVLRMNLSQRLQHAVLALSFIVLAITGFALKSPDSWLARALGSSEPFRRWAHRIAGVVLLLVGAYHLVYILATRDGRRLATDLFPTKKDLADVWTALRYLTGLSKQKPRIGRFGYAEKMEYWAVIWGTAIMGVTGLMIWLKMDVTRFLPRWAVDVALTIHLYEAILACLAILVWHFYHVIFDPDVYPLNLACWDGKVSEHWHNEEHPLDHTTLAHLAKPADKLENDLDIPTPSDDRKLHESNRPRDFAI